MGQMIGTAMKKKTEVTKWHIMRIECPRKGFAKLSF